MTTNTTNITIAPEAKEVETTPIQTAVVYPTTNTNASQLLLHGGIAGAIIIIITFFMAVMMNKVTALAKLLLMYQDSKTDPEDSQENSTV